MVVVDDEEDDGDEKVVEIPDRSVIPHLNSAPGQQRENGTCQHSDGNKEHEFEACSPRRSKGHFEKGIG